MVLQALMIAVTQSWGSQGFEQHCRHMQQVYQQRAQVMHTAATRVRSNTPPALRHPFETESDTGEISDHQP